MRFEIERPRVRKAMPPRKRRRTRAAAATAAPPVPELPTSLLLEIAARSNAATIFRCAAACKPLRRAILSPDFLRRVAGEPDAVVPSSVLGVLGETGFSLVGPFTDAAAAFQSRHLAPFVSRAAAGLLDQYRPLTSRRGLAVLERREINRRRRSERRSDLCVYDPMTNGRAFFPVPPDIGRDPYRGLHGYAAVFTDYVLLTAADGIGCCSSSSSSMLLAADMTKNLQDCSSRIRVQAAVPSSSDAAAGGKWGPVKTAVGDHKCPWWCMHLDSYSDAAVVLVGVVHWLMHNGSSFLKGDVDEHILTYDVNAGTAGSVDLPAGDSRDGDLRGSQLASSPDGKLSLIAVDMLVVSIWVLSGGSWARHADIDMEAEWQLEPWDERGLELVSYGDQRSGVVYLRFGGGVQGRLQFGINMETKMTFLQVSKEETGIPYEVDLAARLSSMKPF